MALTRLVRFVADTEELPQHAAPIVDESSDGGWWGGIAQSFVAVAIASVVAVNTLAAQLPVAKGYQTDEVTQPSAIDDDLGWTPAIQWTIPAVRPIVADEDFSSFPIDESDASAPRVIWDLPLARPFNTDDEIPAATLYGASEPEVWAVPPNGIQVSAQNPRATIADEEFAATAASVELEDESSPQFVVQPSIGSAVRPFATDDELNIVRVDDEIGAPRIPAQTWQQPAPVVVVDDEIPAATLRGAPEEESWANPVAPVPASFIVPPPFAWEQHEQGAGLYGALEDDGRASFVVWPLYTTAQLFITDDERPTNVLDGDDAIPLAIPLAASANWSPIVRPFTTDDDRATFPIDETDSARPVVAPAQTSIVSPFTSDDELPAGRLYGQWEDESWQNAVAPVPQSFIVPAPWSFEQNELAGGLTGRTEDEYWQNRVAPVDQTFIVPAQWGFDQQEPAGSLRVPLEDDGRSVATPWQASSFPQLFATDDELPAATLRGAAEEESWANRVAPVAQSFIPLPSWISEQHEQATGLYGTLEEDGWAPRALWNNASTSPRSALSPLSPLTTDDEFAAFPVDETDLALPIAAVQLAPTIRVAVFVADDDLPQHTAAYDDESAFPPIGLSGQSVSATPRPFIADDEFATVALDETEWTLGSLVGNPALSFQANLGTTIASSGGIDDEIPAASLYLGLEDESWSNPVAPIWLSFIVPNQWTFEQRDHVVPLDAAIAGPRPTTATLDQPIATVTLTHVATVTLDSFTRIVQLEEPSASVALDPHVATATLTTVSATVEIED